LKKLFEKSVSQKPEAGSEDGFLKLIRGKLSKAEIQQLKLSYPLHSAEKYFCLSLSFPEKSAVRINEFLRTLCQPTDIVLSLNNSNTVFLKAFDDTDDDFMPEADFANMLQRNIHEELGIRPTVAVGGNAHSFEGIPDSYLNAMTALRLGKILSPSDKVYCFKEYLLAKLLEELPKQEIQVFLSKSMENMTREIFSDEEIMHTAEQFLQNSLNISETARLLYLHRNTLIYRLDKLEKETGLNIRKFSDAMTFRTLRIILDLFQNLS
jgi:carbohydrate diacid regulator